MQWQQDSDDPTFAYTLQAGARLCKCLGEEFLPYMDAVMPPLINAASEENYFEVMNEEEDEEEEDGDDVATFQVGDKSLSIRISALEEKATACNMLRCYADELKEGFSRCGDAACMQRRRRLLLRRSRSRKRHTFICIAPPLSVSGGLRGQQRSWSLSSILLLGRRANGGSQQPRSPAAVCKARSGEAVPGRISGLLPADALVPVDARHGHRYP